MIRLVYLLLTVLLVLPVYPVFPAGGKGFAAHDRLPVQARLLIDREYFDVLQDGIEGAHTEIVICAYLFKTLERANGYPEKIVKSLTAAVKRGVRVLAVMELSQKSGDLLQTNVETARRLERAGIRVCPDPQNTVTHTKLVVIDRRQLFIGSHNLTQSALRYNHEASVWIDSPAMAKEALDYLDSVCMQGKDKLKHP
ncbi:MAG: phospholipase D-like domain-containing protein [Syntrophales bacterium]